MDLYAEIGSQPYESQANNGPAEHGQAAELLLEHVVDAVHSSHLKISC
jgi:hypothetical protein